MSIDYWCGAVDQTFVFLLLLPFLVGLAGLASEYVGQLWTGRGRPCRSRAVNDQLLMAASESRHSY